MSFPAPPTTNWGSPNAPKRALLIHGLVFSSQSWARIADELAKRDYFVVAPDLLGHGYARRPSTAGSEEYTMAKLAADLHPLLSRSASGPPISLVIGHSLGCLVALNLISSLSNNDADVKYILVDPPLNVASSIVEEVRAFCTEVVTNPQSAKRIAEENLRWEKRDVVAMVVGSLLCDKQVINAVLDQNSPWSYTSLLPADSHSVGITIIAGDPALGALVSTEEINALKKTHPHIRAFAVKDGSHHLHREFPEIVIEEAVGK